MVKSLPATRETQVLSLGWEDPLEKEMATHFSILAWKIWWTGRPGVLQSWGRKELDMAERLNWTIMNWGYIMWNVGLVESQAGINFARRNINKLRCADDTTLMAESEEELNSLLMKMKEESEKAGLKLNIQKTKIKASCPITSWQRDNGKKWKQFFWIPGFFFLGLQNHCRRWLQPWN